MAASQLKILNFLQRGGKTYFNVLLRADGSGGQTIEELADKYDLCLMEAERRNRVIFTSDPTEVGIAPPPISINNFTTDGVVVRSDKKFDLTKLFTDLKAQFPGDSIIALN